MDLEYSEEHRAYREAVLEFLKGWPLQGEAVTEVARADGEGIRVEGVVEGCRGLVPARLQC